MSNWSSDTKDNSDGVYYYRFNIEREPLYQKYLTNPISIKLPVIPPTDSRFNTYYYPCFCIKPIDIVLRLNNSVEFFEVIHLNNPIGCKDPDNCSVKKLLPSPAPTPSAFPSSITNNEQ